MNMQGSEEEMRKWMKPISLDPIDKNGNQKECFVMPSRGLNDTARKNPSVHKGIRQYLTDGSLW